MLMFVFNTIRKNIVSHRKKSILSLLISAMIVLFLLLYMENIEGNENQLMKLGETIPVTARICNIDGSQEVGLQIEFEKLQQIQETGLVTDEVYTIQSYVNLAAEDPQSQRPIIQFIGCNTLSAFTAFSAEDVTYLEGYDESFFTGEEAACIVRETFLEKNNLKLGDELNLVVYAPEYDTSGGQMFQYEKLGPVKLKIVGSYYTRFRMASDELPDVISPLDYVVSAYEDAGIDCYGNSGRFTLQDPLKINEFKSKMQEIGFKSVNVQEGFKRLGEAMTMNDETFILSATQLTESLNLLKSFAPLIFVIVAAIGFIASYLLMQSRRNEFAIMRSLGTSKMGCFRIIFLESLILVLSGSFLGAVISAFVVNLKVTTMGLILAAFIIFYMLGTTIALLLLNRFSVMAILSKTD
ncbi:MAG: transporter permease [Anaerocolumna sp.]|nr:transporter permease [Anaerocolumna sp.]